MHLKPPLIFVTLSGHGERHSSSCTQEPGGRDGQSPAYQSEVSVRAAGLPSGRLSRWPAAERRAWTVPTTRPSVGGGEIVRKRVKLSFQPTSMVPGPDGRRWQNDLLMLGNKSDERGWTYSDVYLRTR